MVATDLTVNLNITGLVLADFDSLLAGEGVSQSVAEQDREGNALSQLVGACGGARRVHASQFVQTPVGRCEHALHMLLWSSCLHIVNITPVRFPY